MDEKDKQKIKDDVQADLIGRNSNTIPEKISYCIGKGMTEDEARHTVIQIVKNLPSVLLPLRVIQQEKDVLVLTNQQEFPFRYPGDVDIELEI